MSAELKIDSLALPSLSSTLYFRHVHRTCNDRVWYRYATHSTRHSRVHTMTDSTVLFLLHYSYSSFVPSWASRRLDTSGNSSRRIGERRPSRPFCLRCHRCNSPAGRRFQERRIRCSCRRTILQGTFFFRLVHSRNVRFRHREECILCGIRYQTTSVSTLSNHRTVGIWFERYGGFQLGVVKPKAKI